MNIPTSACDCHYQATSQQHERLQNGSQLEVCLAYGAHQYQHVGPQPRGTQQPHPGAIQVGHTRLSRAGDLAALLYAQACLRLKCWKNNGIALCCCVLYERCRLRASAQCLMQPRADYKISI